MKKLLYILPILLLPILAFGQDSETDIDVSDYRIIFYDNLNKIRLQHLKPKLKRDTVLEKECEVWLTQMIKKYHGKLRHGSVNTGNKFKGEVLADCQGDFLICWLNSPGHRKIIMRFSAKRIGICVIDGLACARVSD